MTTIAFDGKILASDSRQICSTTGVILNEQKVKIHNIDGVAVGFAGDSCLELSALLWVAKVFSGDERLTTERLNWAVENKPNLKDSYMIIIGRHGEIMECNESGFEFHKASDGVLISIGTGWRFALSAMKLGLSADKAVLHAADFDCGTNRILQIVTV